MKTPEFLKKLSTLTFLPEGKRARARAIAEHLTDAQLEELFKELENANAELGEIHEEGEEVAEDMDHLVTDFEKLIGKTERTMEEGNENEENLTTIEQKLDSK